ncbi:ATP synthase subunit delta [bioreactor metagenome]|jgi:F-type H+-transporting ATPase subunit delta|uniref:ATP synthase subunit delta n=1 Tax=bioreactor metagenome TaxID=1076179 RepID=A0A645DLH0_9ZZZZ
MLHVYVTTAVALSTAEQEKIEKKLLHKLAKKDPQFHFQVDPRLLGGLQLSVDSVLYDASLRAKLDQLTSELVK